jgi:hypothetical protein
MANMTDYLRWRGDLAMDEFPLNDADALVLSCLSYIDLAGFVPIERAEGAPFASLREAVAGGPTVTVRDAVDGLLSHVGGDISGRLRTLASLDADWLRALGDSRRFGGLLLHDYQDVLDESRALQFAALQVDLPDGDSFVSFRGTDLTIVGWREDFMLSFTQTESQKLAREYMERAVRRASRRGRRVLVGGHSKGGNLAAFGAASCPEPLRDRIGTVWSFDGPGMAHEVMPRSACELLGERYRRFVPAYSVIGMLFDHPEEPRTYVRSTADRINQHDPMSWELTPRGLVDAGELQGDARIIDEAIERWYSDVPLAERAAFVNELFDVLGAGGATSFDGMYDPASVQKVLSAAANASDASKDIVAKLVSSTVSTTVDAYRSAASEAIDSARSAAASALASAGESVAEQTADLLKTVAGRVSRHAGERGSRGEADQADEADSSERALQGGRDGALATRAHGTLARREGSGRIVRVEQPESEGGDDAPRNATGGREGEDSIVLERVLPDGSVRRPFE